MNDVLAVARRPVNRTVRSVHQRNRCAVSTGAVGGLWGWCLHRLLCRFLWCVARDDDSKLQRLLPSGSVQLRRIAVLLQLHRGL